MSDIDMLGVAVLVVCMVPSITAGTVFGAKRGWYHPFLASALMVAWVPLTGLFVLLFAGGLLMSNLVSPEWLSAAELSVVALYVLPLSVCSWKNRKLLTIPSLQRSRSSQKGETASPQKPSGFQGPREGQGKTGTSSSSSQRTDYQQSKTSMGEGSAQSNWGEEKYQGDSRRRQEPARPLANDSENDPYEVLGISISASDQDESPGQCGHAGSKDPAAC